MIELSILTLALVERRAMRERLAQVLEPQLSDSVEWIVLEDDGERSYGSKMREGFSRCTGRFIAVVDDDDLVAPEYVEELLAAIRRGNVDVVTFRAFREDTAKLWSFCFGDFVEGEEISEVSGGFFITNGRVVMMANHLCAWRRVLAIQIPWLSIQYGADVCWYRTAAAAFPFAREFHIPRILYRYSYNPNVTHCQRQIDIDLSMCSVAGGIRAWRVSPGGRLFLSAFGADLQTDEIYESVIDNYGRFHKISRERLELLTTTILK